MSKTSLTFVLENLKEQPYLKEFERIASYGFYCNKYDSVKMYNFVKLFKIYKIDNLEIVLN